MSLQAIIVDDEPLARERVRGFLDERDEVEVLAECCDGLEAVAAIDRYAPDLVFLDVQMPGLDGFGVLREVGAERMPAVIFTTAFDHYAVDAFEANAVDYLLKPFDRRRFAQALERALEHCRRRRAPQADGRLLSLLDAVAERRRASERLSLRTTGGLYVVRMEAIDWVEAARNYVKVHVGEDCHTLRETLTCFEERLDPERFLRIHRSTIVNVDRIRRIAPGFGSESIAELVDGTRLVISRAYRRGRVRRLLG